MHIFLRRLARRAVLTVGILALAVFTQGAVLTSVARADTPQAVISLTFDDSDADQYANAFPILQQYGMHGTFYVITGYIGVNSGYMTLPQLHDLANAGNEIAAHTVLHPDLTQLSTDEVTRQLCQSRNTLLNWGFSPTSFAYPYGSFNSATEGIAQQCGFNSARADASLQSPVGCQGCALTESIPPADPYAINAPQSVQSTWSLADVESLVTQAESTGGWMPIIFHHICDNNCNPYSITPADFSAFLAWLQTQPVSVQTVNQVMGGSVQPAVNAPQVPPAAPGVNGVVNSSLETDDPYNAGTPYCWRTAGSGTNSPSFAETGTAHSGSVGETITMSSYSNGDAKFLTKQDLGQCAPSVVPGDQYVTSAWYQSTVPTRFAFYYRDNNGGWHYWTQSPQFPASSSWTQATWGTPAIPAGATALSYGMNIAANGTLSLDDFSLVDTAGPPVNPTVSLTAPSSGATLSGQVTFSANASSAIGISKVDYLINGVVMATATSAPYTATWDSTTVGDGPVTVTARATDVAGNQTTTSGLSATISNAASRGGNMLANASLETNTGGGSTPDCWNHGGTGTWTASWAYTNNAHSGNNAENLTISSYTSGNAVLNVTQGTGPCAPRVSPGSTYTLSTWYQSTAPTNIIAWYQNSSGSWVYWTQSKAIPASSGWAQAGWTTPAVPSGAVALSFGLALAATGSVTTDDYSMVAGAPAAPAVSLTAPSSGATLSGQVTFSANASSSTGISKVDFLVNGVVVGTATSAPYTTTWDSSTVGDGPVTVTARATDVTGQQATTSGQAATISNAASRGGNMLANASVETYSGSGSVPDCWTQGGSGTATFAWSKTSSAHSGNWAQNVTITSYTSGDRKLVTAQNTSACSPRVNPGSTYNLGAWYQSNQPTHIVAYYLNSSGSWVYWTQSPVVAASSTWAHATWTTPAVPAGATAVSFGLNLGAVGSLTTDDYTMTSN
jgi:peptidoglycan/xylan/chitin deacetylase (PgdA/CDA1 family)/archaellum component FlaF (FlaF/FlaG flagellin family)